MRLLKDIFIYLWQTPQHLLGLLIWNLIGHKVIITTKIGTSTVYWLNTKADWGVSLGSFIFLNANIHTRQTAAHEYGHSIQSKRWGPAYLCTVGVVSVILNILTRLRLLPVDKYYTVWPENEADTLGGVKR